MSKKHDMEKARHWQAVIRDAARSGMSTRAFCRRRKLKESQFYWWQRRLKEKRRPVSTPPGPGNGVPGYMKRAADWLYANPKELGSGQRASIMLTPGLAYIAETTGGEKYWDDAFASFRSYVEQGQVTDRLKLFAQLFRNSQRFLWHLSSEAHSPSR